ncbi:transmembrane protein 98-like [Athalia rosae]|uniref:transmembrane protein 98-like n=1 Tax=Athalia rosae TaxID=37344 RepID=UPI000626EA39|nr:transmembrane protein 98-like [Athalia rosae]XP_012257810.1 transmembrane protein 98-like [Athalia rosae]XP_020708618.1 transmembrane protein 98-like [Athalia rosae]XP_048512894.1 transmembrane protein 98-like [Athalia rosae]XP_048512921.1 transmembrane protein 98-like [Athalia rosae]
MSSPLTVGSPGPAAGAPAMETVVVVALGALAAVFLGALLVLLVICRRQRCYYKHKDSQDLNSDLLEGENGGALGLEAWEGEEWLIDAERWVDDATGLAPPCIAVLRSCHSLAASLTAIAGTVNSNTVPLEIVDVARRIPPRVDDVVRSLYPPLDARLLEARVAALVLAVTHLALVTKHGIPKSQARKLAFIDQALNDMDSHLLVLRDAALAQEAACAIPASTPV